MLCNSPRQVLGRGPEVLAVRDRQHLLVRVETTATARTAKTGLGAETVSRSVAQAVLDPARAVTAATAVTVAAAARADAVAVPARPARTAVPLYSAVTAVTDALAETTRAATTGRCIRF